LEAELRVIFATLGFVVFATLSVHAAPGVPPLGAFLAALAGITSAAAAQISGLPGPLPLPPPTIYSAPTPAPLAPPINPGPAVVPPAGLSPLLTEPGPIYRMPERESPSYPPPPTPGPIDQQKMQFYRNGLLDQQRQLERSGVSPGSERSREIQQQLNQPSSR
jgi:hypothetical protein